MQVRPVEILLVEDNEGDIRLVQEALNENKIHNTLHVARDGVEAMEFLKRLEPFETAPTPDLILLDLNLPRKNGREVLVDLKADPRLSVIPVVVLTTSTRDQDVVESYRLHANCYVTKPVDLDRFIEIVQQVESYWFSIVKLPPAR